MPANPVDRLDTCPHSGVEFGEAILLELFVLGDPPPRLVRAAKFPGEDQVVLGIRGRCESQRSSTARVYGALTAFIVGPDVSQVHVNGAVGDLVQQRFRVTEVSRPWCAVCIELACGSQTAPAIVRPSMMWSRTAMVGLWSTAALRRPSSSRTSRCERQRSRAASPASPPASSRRAGGSREFVGDFLDRDRPQLL